MEELEQRSRAATVASNPAEYDPSSQAFKDKYGPTGKARGTTMVPIRGKGMMEVSDDSGFTEGIGSGMVRTTRGLGNLMGKAFNAHPIARMEGNLFGVDDFTPEVASTENIREQDALDKPLEETTKGKLGQVFGGAAVASGVTGPLGSLGGGAAGGSVLARTLGASPTRAVLEGGVGGASVADPDAQGEGAAKGAVLALTLNRLLAGGGRVIRGLVNKSEAAKNLDQIAGQHGEEVFVPISQAASEGDTVSRLAKTLYSEGLSFIPGVKGQLTRQASDAAASVRELAIKEATPDGVTIPPGAGRRVGETIHTLRGEFNKAYDSTIKQYAFNVPDTFKDDVSAAVKAAIPNIDDTTLARVVALADEQMTRFSSGKPTIDGGNLLNVKNELGRLVGQAPRVEKPAVRIAQQHIEDIIDDQLTQGGSKQNIADLAKYGNLSEPYRHFVSLNKAAKSARANGGNFTMNQLARAATDPTQLDLAQQAGGVLNNPAAGTSFTGRGLLGGAGLIGAGATMGPAAAGGLLLAGNAMATKTVQKALMGDLAAQRSLAEMIQQNPKAAEEIARLMQILTAQQAGDSDE